MKSKKEYFVPLNVEKKYWQTDKLFIFLDPIFERQFSKEELSKLKYTTLPSFTYKYSKQEIDFFEAQIIKFFQCELNSFHGVNFDFLFWRKLFTPYLKNCITNIFSKVEELSNLVRKFPDSNFYTFSFSKEIDVKFLKEFEGLFSNEKYNNYIFAKVAADFFNFNVIYDNRKEERKCEVKVKFEKNTKTNNRFSWKKLVKSIIRHFLKPKLLLWCTYFSGDATKYFYRKSFGRIKCLDMENIDDNSEIDYQYRKVLNNKFFDFFNVQKLPLEKQVVLALLPEILPFYYIENFMKYLNSADSFLKKCKAVKCFFATCTYCRETKPFLLTYAQTKGLKALTEIHGGDYGIVSNRHEMECFLNDTIYIWGAWGNDVFDTSCKIEIAPSFRQHLLYDNTKMNAKYILFLGSCTVYYIYSCHAYLSGHEGFHKSMNSEIEFFKTLNDSARKSMLVRNYLIDFGYHFNDTLHSELPDLKIQNYSQADYDENFDPVARNNSFAQTLLDCSLILVNEFETCFIEALYCEKPFIVLFNKFNFPLRIEEIPYFKMMEDVGLLFYDWNKAAELVNEIHNDIQSWWNHVERQKVVKIIRNRYSIKVDNPTKWWYNELKRQIKIAKKEFKEKKRIEKRKNNNSN